jgi:phage protein D
MTEPAVHPYSSHGPVFTVDSRVEGAFARDLLRLDIEEGTLGLRSMVVHLHAVGPDSDGSSERLSYLDGEVLGLGSTIDVDIGPPGGERHLFHGTVSAVEVCFAEGEAPYVSVFAEDALMRLRIAERTASYVDMSDAEIVEQVVGDHGLALDADLDGPTYPLVQQWEESDLAFIRDRALRLDAEVWAGIDDIVHLADRADRPGAQLTLVQGNELIAVELRADLAHQRSQVEFRGWDDVRVEAVSAVATADLVRTEIDRGRVGPAVVADVFEPASISRSRRDVLSSEVAQAYANAEMRRRARRFVSVDGTTSGTPDLVPGTKLDLRRVGRPFEGDAYRCVYAHHSYDPSTGYRTRFRAERPGMAS